MQSSWLSTFKNSSLPRKNLRCCETISLQDTQSNGVRGAAVAWRTRRKHWQGYPALHCRDQKGNAPARTCQRTSQKINKYINQDSFERMCYQSDGSGVYTPGTIITLFLKSQGLHAGTKCWIEKASWHAALVCSDKRQNGSISILSVLINKPSIAMEDFFFICDQ